MAVASMPCLGTVAVADAASDKGEFRTHVSLNPGQVHVQKRLRKGGVSGAASKNNAAEVLEDEFVVGSSLNVHPVCLP